MMTSTQKKERDTRRIRHDRFIRRFPFEEHGSYWLPSRRHRLTGFLSSCSVGLQSLENHAPSTVLVWRSRRGLGASTPASAVFSVRNRFDDDSSPLSSHALAVTFREKDQNSLAGDPADIASAPHNHRGPSMGFVTLRRLRQRVATNTGFTSPGCAAPSGFLSLLTLPSTRRPSRLVSCE
jgi:hypothetical protein